MPSDDYYAKGKYSGEIARRYDAMREAAGDRYKAEDDLIGGYIASLPLGTTVLDAPVGTGRFLRFFAARKCTVYGVDISQDMLEIAAEKAGNIDTEINLQIGDITNLEFEDGAVDYFISNKFIKWLPSSRHALHALQELHRVAARGGLVEIRCVDTPALEIFGRYAGVIYNLGRSLTGKKPRNTKIYAKSHARRLLRSAGFTILSEQILSEHRKKSVYFTLK